MMVGSEESNWFRNNINAAGLHQKTCWGFWTKIYIGNQPPSLQQANLLLAPVLLSPIPSFGFFPLIYLTEELVCFRQGTVLRTHTPVDGSVFSTITNGLSSRVATVRWRLSDIGCRKDPQRGHTGYSMRIIPFSHFPTCAVAKSEGCCLNQVNRVLLDFYILLSVGYVNRAP